MHPHPTAWRRLRDGATPLTRRWRPYLMSTTKQFKSGDTNLTIKRPSYRAFQDIAAKVEALLEIEPAAAMTVPEFEEVLRACVQDVGGEATRKHLKRTKPDSETGVEQELDK